MEEKTAWQKFYKSGLIADYLSYINEKERTHPEDIHKEENINDVYKDGRNHHKGTNHR